MRTILQWRIFTDENIETPIFTKRLRSILNNEKYRLLQNTLIIKPDSGKIIRGSGGLRKMRWSGSGRGKRGGSRIIYYWVKEKEIILMLFIYKKRDADDLSTDQLKLLKLTVEGELK